MSGLALLALLSAATPSTVRGKAAATSSLSRMTLEERCTLARLLAKQMRDVLEWVDRRKLDRTADHFADGALDLAVFESTPDDPSRPLLREGERCESSLPLLFAPGKIQVRIAAGCPPRMKKPYAVLFGKDLARGRRWEFLWELNTSYTGCDGVVAGGVSRIQVAAPRIRLLVGRKRNEFSTTQATLEMGRWSETIAD